MTKNGVFLLRSSVISIAFAKLALADLSAYSSSMNRYPLIARCPMVFIVLNAHSNFVSSQRIGGPSIGIGYCGGEWGYADDAGGESNG